MVSTAKEKNSSCQNQNQNTGEEILKTNKGNEIFIAIVGPAGSGAGTAALRLEDFLANAGYQTSIIKASTLIKESAESAGLNVPNQGRKTLEGISRMQDLGDKLRQGKEFNRIEDHSAVARLILQKIRRERSRLQDSDNIDTPPDGKKKAYIIDSLRHPAEVNLLRRVYQESFFLIGVVCDPEIREKRIENNLFDRNQHGRGTIQDEIKKFLRRDEDAQEKYGQHVSDTFHESDYFIDNSDEGNRDLTITGMNHNLKRFVSLISHETIIRPSISETAMHLARSAQMRSACLSRQVGASLVDKNGNVIATGTNEVPKAGGGVYGKGFENESASTDHRCAYRDTVFCSSNEQQNEIINELLDALPEILTRANVENKGIENIINNLTQKINREIATKEIRKTRIGGLIEFSRAVHAEMDAILSAATSGISPKGCRLFVTTFPCHYCARHIVAAGIDEVQYIEPYPKSKAITLHSDAITTKSKNWTPPSHSSTENPNNIKSLFKPFVGVAPRMYRRVFLKDRPYKDKTTGLQKIGNPQWGSHSENYIISYLDLEKKIGLSPTDE
jgi:deoxycytidylate deaminase